MFSLLLSIAATLPQASASDLLPTARDAPGCALDVRRDGRTLETAATGLANLEDMTAIGLDTIFEIGSVSKQFVGAGLAILAGEGRLRMNDPVSRWLPELPQLYREVTVAMLANHTSGIRSWNNLAELTGRGEDSTGYDNGWVLAAVARQHALNNAPGTEYLYSNSNFVLGAIIIERASGKPLNDFFRATLFDRLGMDRTEWRIDFRKIVRGRAQAYAPDDREGWRLDMPLNGVAGAGGLLSTVGDLQRWNEALANPAPRDRAWVAALLKPGALADGTTLRYGLGIQTDPVGDLPAWSHAGSTGSYRAWLGYVPGERLSVALLCNSGAVNTEDLGPEVAARFLPAQSESRRSALHASVPKGLAGLYRDAANDAVVEAKVDTAGLHLNGGPGYGSSGEDTLTTADGRRSATLLRDRTGAVTGMTVTRIGNAPTTLVREQPWVPTTVELTHYVGSYASDEIDGVQRIEMQGDGLVWRDPSGAPHPLVAVYRGGFEAPDASWTLRFKSGAGGTMALDISITRARRISFSRRAIAAPSRR